MTATLPLIRAASLMPLVNWMRRVGWDPAPLLRECRLPEAPEADPGRLVPFVSVARFVGEIARAEGPDAPIRAITDQSASELSELSSVVLRAGTPREGFQRLVTGFSRMNTHVAYAFQATPGAAILRHRYIVPLPGELLHLAQQTVVALLRAALGWTGVSGPRLSRVEMTPHPKFGLDHLRAHLDCELVASEKSGLLVITMPEAVVDRPFVRPGRDKLPLAREWPAARTDGTLRSSILTALPVLMEFGQPSLHEVAELACMSSRTLQRRLRDEGATLSELIDTVRRDWALARLANSHDRVGDIAIEVGYADIAGLSRAVRRWTSLPPRNLRSR